MEPVQPDPTIGFHVVAMPYPGRGHINPMMNLCKLLSSRWDRIAITFVVTEEWLGILGSEPKPVNVRFATVPNVIPSEFSRGADFPSFFEAVMTKLQEPFERLLDHLEPNFIVYDTLLAWVVGVGNRRNIPVASLWITPASLFAMLQHVDLLAQNGHFPVNLAVLKTFVLLPPVHIFLPSSSSPPPLHPVPNSNVEMEPVQADPTIGFHVVAMPYPGRGHINPMLNLCKLLASRNDRIAITFVVTEEWLGILGSEPKPVNVCFATVPNVIPSEIGRGANFPSFFEAVMTKLQEPFERLLDRLEPSVIMYDTVLGWMVGVGDRRNIPVASLWTMQASVFPVNLSEKENEQIDYRPGIPDNLLKAAHQILEAISLVPKTQYLLLTSIYELESHTIDTLRNIISIPIYSIGPAIPYFNLKDKDKDKDNDNDNDNDYVQWLNSQPKSSVLYVSQGSFLSVSQAQMDEIIVGVKNSGVRFLWVARGEASRIKELCGSDEGFVVPWCEQLKVLCHPSIGGFWSHCGWNSTKEGVFAGVPFLTYPILADQIPNSKTIVEDWKMGWKVRRGIGMEEQLVTREDIAGLVRRFMDLENEEGKEMRKKAKELREICRRATSKGGSAETEIDAFIRDISLSFNH